MANIVVFTDQSWPRWVNHEFGLQVSNQFYFLTPSPVLDKVAIQRAKDFWPKSNIAKLHTNFEQYAQGVFPFTWHVSIYVCTTFVLWAALRSDQNEWP